MVKIEFFLQNKSLGVFDCPEGSSYKEREDVAWNNDITNYDMYILDDNRIICKKLHPDQAMTVFKDSEGYLWIAFANHFLIDKKEIK